jgi:hypothetical protein
VIADTPDVLRMAHQANPSSRFADLAGHTAAGANAMGACIVGDAQVNRSPAMSLAGGGPEL